MKIIKLSDNLIKKIAAGEVIAHPSNALKEIVENAIDAQSTHITIHINGNGLEKITIIDNGIGMELDDLKICTQLHTTSKTKEDDHLFGMYTLGFRGEALASIDAISNLTIESNSNKLEKGTITHSNVLKGTKIEINNLFEHLPARLKFLKSSAVEWNLLKQTIQKFAIKYENITWTIFNNNKKYAHYEKTDHNSRLNQIFKDDFVHKSHSYDNTDFDLYLFKSHKNQQHIFVNNRAVKDNAIANYIRSIFKEFFMKHESPSYVLFIKIDPIFVDCNVHPAKEEVKFISYSNIFGALSYLISPTLLKELYSVENVQTFDFVEHSPIVSHNNELQPNNNIFSFNKNNNHDCESENIAYVCEDDALSNPTLTYSFPLSSIFENKEEQSIQTKIIDTQFQPRIIGQIKNSFIIFETEDGIGIFDQHAAHEREIYEQMKAKLSRNSAQHLLNPIILQNLSNEQIEFLNENTEKFASKGIVLSNNIITHIPHVLSSEDFATVFAQYLDISIDCEIMIDRLLADIACKNALKANTALSHFQCVQLLETAMTNVPICNHGRPVFKYFKTSEIANWFKRT